jgi:HAE1 family hydrophobic/amphiphilic exporter-1
MLVSFTLDPMLSSIWHDPHHHGDHHKGPVGRLLDWCESSLDRLAESYGSAILWALAHRKTVLAGAVALLIGSFALAPIIGGEFIPRSDQGEFALTFKTAPGSSLDYTVAKAHEVEARLRELPQVKTVEIQVAGGSFGASKSDARLTVDVGDKGSRHSSLFVLMEQARNKAQRVAGIQIGSVEELGKQGPMGKPVNIGVRGGDVAELERQAKALSARLAAIPGVTDVDSSLSAADPALNLSVRRDAAASLGIDLAQVGETLSTLLAGNTVTTWEAPDGENYDVHLQIPKQARAAELLDVLTVAGKRGTQGNASMVPLSTLSEARSASAPRQIDRVDLQREVTITANIGGREPSAVFADINKLLAGLELPSGLTLSQQGEQKDMAESLGYAVQALAMGVIFIYLILAAQFRSFTLPVTIMVSLPLAFVGVFWGLLAFGSTLNMFSVIGIVMLMGLAAKNGILLVDFINQARREGMERSEAIVLAGKVRLRPIMMTSLAMIFGMLPLALGHGEGSETRAPMAHAIIGGLITSTLLTLLVLPVVYTYLDGLRSRLRRGLARLNAGRAA